MVLHTFFGIGIGYVTSLILCEINDIKLNKEHFEENKKYVYGGTIVGAVCGICTDIYMLNLIK